MADTKDRHSGGVGYSASSAAGVGVSNAANLAVSSNFSNSSLEYKLKQLRDESVKHSQTLTQKLATSQSGQNLLHMGTALSSLPPDLHQLVTQLHPLLSNTESTEKKQVTKLHSLLEKQNEIRMTQQRVHYAHRLASTYHDLTAAESIIRKQQQQNKRQSEKHAKHQEDNDDESEDDDDDGTNDQEENGDSIRYATTEADLDNAAALERAAHIALLLLEELQNANEFFTTMNTSAKQQPPPQQVSTSIEQAQFIIKLGSRIRRLESDTALGLSKLYERMLRTLQEVQTTQTQQSQKNHANSSESEHENRSVQKDSDHQRRQQQQEQQLEILLLILGHCMRGLALIGHSRDVEQIFARTAIVPLVRTKVSVGLLDDGGSRGECKGLTKLLNDLTSCIATAYGPLLSRTESIFCIVNNNKADDSGNVASSNNSMEIDLLTAGVWVPIVSAFMADNAIKMAIFSPGIASILQANYMALDNFLSQLAINLLVPSSTTTTTATMQKSQQMPKQQYQYYYQPVLLEEQIHHAQERIYAHAKTTEFAKKWNLPIYYQLRFGECCTRLNKAIDTTKKQGWIASDVYTGSTANESIRTTIGLELGLFMELYDIIVGVWKPDVILRPLTNRFLRGAIQLIGRVVQFVSDGMDGTILFGDEVVVVELNGNNSFDVSDNGDSSTMMKETSERSATALIAPPQLATRKPYCWGESEDDIAAVTWELTILDSAIRHDYVTVVCNALSPRSDSNENSQEELDDIRASISEVLAEASTQIYPVIDKAWNDYIVKILIAKCSGPLAAVKGVAATYRMTNRPPPTQASPFVGTILRPLKEFDTEFANRAPERVGLKWKQNIVTTVADRYATSVEELISTVQRTEEALKNRKARRAVGPGGAAAMSDGEKVKLQLFLDYQLFADHVKEIGIEPSTVIGLSKLQELTSEGERLLEQQRSK